MLVSTSKSKMTCLICFNLPLTLKCQGPFASFQTGFCFDCCCLLCFPHLEFLVSESHFVKSLNSFLQKSSTGHLDFFINFDFNPKMNHHSTIFHLFHNKMIVTLEINFSSLVNRLPLAKTRWIFLSQCLTRHFHSPQS